MYFTVLAWNYAACLAFLILCTSFRRRLTLYFHTYSHCLSLLVAGVLYATEATGPSVVSTCFVARQQWGASAVLLLLAYAPFYLVAILFTLPRRGALVCRQISPWHGLYLCLLLFFSLPMCWAVVSDAQGSVLED